MGEMGVRHGRKFQEGGDICMHIAAWGFPGGSVVKTLPPVEGDKGDVGSVPGLGRSPRGGNGSPF